jgi:hypothetical protein
MITIIVCGCACLLCGVTGYVLGFRDSSNLHDEVLAASHTRLTVNPTDKIRIPATRSTDLVPEKL